MSDIVTRLKPQKKRFTLCLIVGMYTRGIRYEGFTEGPVSKYNEPGRVRSSKLSHTIAIF